MIEGIQYVANGGIILLIRNGLLKSGLKMYFIESKLLWRLDESMEVSL